MTPSGQQLLRYQLTDTTNRIYSETVYNWIPAECSRSFRTLGTAVFSESCWSPWFLKKPELPLNQFVSGLLSSTKNRKLYLAANGKGRQWYTPVTIPRASESEAILPVQ